MNRSRLLIGALASSLVLAALAPMAMTASSPTTGSIEGTVYDEARKPIPGADVVLVNVETGYLQEIKTNEAGVYAGRFLPLGFYSITASLAGYGSVIRDGIRLAIGQSLNVDLTLNLMTISENIKVTAEAPIVEVRTTQIATVVNEKAIETLPLLGRNFTDHVALTPGAVLNPTGYRVNITGQRGINNSIMMDGVDNNSAFFGEQRGGTRPPFTFSQEAVKEFEVINNGFSAEYGRAGGAIINAVTKSGTNDFHSSAFLYYRDENLVERDANDNERTDFEQEQFGVTFGGPIVQDKAFYFFAYDQQLLDRPIFSSLDMREFYWNLAGRPGEEEDFTDYQDSYTFTLPTGEDFTIERGQYIQTEDQSSFLLKGDWQISGNHRLTVRNSLNLYESQNGTFGSGDPSANGLEESISDSVTFQLTSIFGPSLFNDVRLQYSWEDRPRGANTTAVPETSISGFGTFGQTNYLPNGLTESRIQLVEGLTKVTEAHELKGGFDMNFLRIEDDFFRYGGGSYSFNSVQDFIDHLNGAGDIDYSYTQAFDRTGNDGIITYNTSDHALYGADTWTPRDNLTVNYGLRYEYQVHPNPDPPSYAEWSSRLPYGEQFDPETGENVSRSLWKKMKKVDEDPDNLAPRLGIAWSPGTDQKTVMRAGAGIFYSRTPSLLVANALLNNGYQLAQYDFYGSSLPDWPDRAPAEPTGTSQTPNIYVFADDFENPETYRFNLGIEREVIRNLSMGVDYIFARTVHLERPIDINLMPPDHYDEEGRAIYTRTKRDNNFGKVIEFRSDAESNYNGLTLKAQKRYGQFGPSDLEMFYQFLGSYTYAVSQDNNSNERSVGTDFGYPSDPYDFGAEWGYSEFDVRHRVVLSGTLDLPAAWPVTRGMSLSAIMQYQSGRPFNATTGSDSNRDGYRDDRPIGVARNAFRHPHYETIDLRYSYRPWFGVFESFELEFIAEAFNVFNATNRYVYYTQQVWGRDDFGEAFGAGNPRQYQFGLRVRY